MEWEAGYGAAEFDSFVVDIGRTIFYHNLFLKPILQGNLLQLFLLLLRQFLLRLIVVDLLFQIVDFIIELRLHFLFPDVQVIQYLGVGHWLRKCEVDGVVIVFEGILKLQSIVIKRLPLLRLINFARSFLIRSIS